MLSVMTFFKCPKRFFLKLSIFFLVNSSICVGETSLSKNNWPSITTRDLSFTYNAIKRIAPYTYFQSEPKLGKWLSDGYKKALNEAKSTSSFTSYKMVMNRYINGFKIEHLYINFHNSTETQHPTKKSGVLKVVSHPFLKNGIWIKIPSFQAGDKSFNHPQLTQTLIKLIKDLPLYRNKNLIVFDVRGNGGGSNKLSRPIIVSLYSKKYLRSLGASFIYNQKWRYIDSLAPEALKFYGDKSKILAAKQGYRLYEGSFWPVIYGQEKHQTFQRYPNPVKAHVIILADSRCGSMCYQFTRTLLDLPNTVLVGQPPDVMDRLTNPRSVILPSRKATLSVGTREMLSPAYAFGRRLMPHYRYYGNINNTPAIEKWIMQLYTKMTHSNL